jgi:hypothetical protein
VEKVTDAIRCREGHALIAWSATVRARGGLVNVASAGEVRHHGRMGRAAVRALVGVVILGLTLAGAAAAGAAHRSGVSGRVARDTPCDVVPDLRCDHRGVAATVRVERARSGRLVRTVRAGTGHFRIRLQPGRYRLRATADDGNGAGSVVVRVKRHRFASIVVQLHGAVP